MKHFDFFKHDLNLLVAFDALYEERSVSRAAVRVGITQSAMSQALGRLRRMLRDDLFVRHAAGVAPTRVADTLAPRVAGALREIHAVLVEGARFDPAVAQRVFTLSMPDAQQLVLLPDLLARLRAAAPGSTLRTVPFDRKQLDEALATGDVDLAIGRFDGEASQALHGEDLYEEQHVCLYNPALVKVRGAAGDLSVDEYLRWPAVLLAFGGDTRGVLDDKLAALGKARQVIATTPYAHVLPFLLERVAAIGIVPSRVAWRCLAAARLRAAAPPVALPAYRVRAVWHARADGDPGLVWLRGVIRAVAAAAPPALAPEVLAEGRRRKGKGKGSTMRRPAQTRRRGAGAL